ncbi:amino acid synthesis family protein [Brevibacillus massiliensis]|jgi:hypothetical protein|uniref:amino acid synthesis family protein n=1 Tax=Brevibacillus massiliensis TaxID=1118054 RepID=UPI0002EB8E68|nr:amino acid synthesis family protein [Brevibacillus massiliensis]
MLDIRKVYTAYEELRSEGGREVNPPIAMAAVAAVITNPWAGRGYVENLKPEIDEIAPKLGELLVGYLFKLVGSADDVEAYGKAANVGLNGELEHANALIHTLKFGNKFRDAVHGTSILPFSSRRAGAGSLVTIPMVHKTDESMRSHYLTFEFNIGDAPREDEMIVAIGVSTGGRPFPRIGNRHQDMKEMGLV